MIATCTECHTRHQLKTEGFKGPAVKYRCSKCGHMNKALLHNQKDDDKENPIEAEVSSQEYSNTAQNQVEASATRLKTTGFSIKTKLTFVIVTLIFLSITIISSIASFKGENALSKQAQDHLRLITNQKAKEYNDIFSRLQDEIEGIAIYATQTFNRPYISDNLDFDILMPWTGNEYGTAEMRETFSSDILALQQIGVVLQGLVKKNPYLELGYMATQNNVMVLDDEKVVGIIAAEKGYVPTKRPWYLNAVEKGSTVWTQPYVDVNTKKLIVSCATPVFNNQKSIVGVIGFDVLLDTIQKDIISLDIGYNSQAFLLGKDGNFLAKPGVISTDSAWNMAVKADSALNSDNLEFRKIILDMIAGKSGVGTHMENGSTSIVSYAPLNAIDASVGIVISEKEVMKPARDIRQLIMGVWVAVVIVSIFIGLIIGNGITKPINELSMKADLISQGKSDLTEITTKRKDEIGLLIESYNRLIASLKIAMSRRQK